MTRLLIVQGLLNPQMKTPRGVLPSGIRVSENVNIYRP
jgi:hypothetical protein